MIRKRSPVPPAGYVMDGGRRHPDPPQDWRAEAKEWEGSVESKSKNAGQQERRIRISAGPVTMEAVLNASRTADLVWAALPIRSACMTWGDEIYFDVPVETGGEDAQAKVPSGTIAYWPPGPSFCIFFGQTPASPVNIVGSLDGDPRKFAKVREGDPVRLEKA